MNQFTGVHLYLKQHGMDMGILGLGSEEDDFIGTKNLELKRDTRFPIRCTFQYYRVTDENSINEHYVKDIAEQLNQATKIALDSGSLVLSTTDRKTEPTLNKPVPTDNPFQKFENKTHLNKLQQNVWGNNSIVGFI